MNRYEDLYAYMVERIGEIRATDLYQPFAIALSKVIASRTQRWMLSKAHLEMSIDPREMESYAMRHLAIYATAICKRLPELEDAPIFVATRSRDASMVLRLLIPFLQGA